MIRNLPTITLPEFRNNRLYYRHGPIEVVALLDQCSIWNLHVPPGMACIIIIASPLRGSKLHRRRGLRVC